MHKVQYRLFRRRKPARQVLLLNLKKLGKVGAGVPFMTFHLRGARKNSAEIRSWLICPAPFKLMQTKLSNFRSWHKAVSLLTYSDHGHIVPNHDAAISFGLPMSILS